jgi:hypothetical protein
MNTGVSEEEMESRRETAHAESGMIFTLSDKMFLAWERAWRAWRSRCGLASLASMLLQYGAALTVSQRQGVARVFAVLA